MDKTDTQQSTRDRQPGVASGERVPTAEDNSSAGRGQRNRNRGRSGKGAVFHGECEDLHGIVYDAGLPHSHQDLFTTVTRQIAEYVARKFEHAGEFRLGMTTLSLPPLTMPTAPGKDDGLGAIEIYKIDLREHRAALKHRQENQERIFSLLLGQCSRTIRDRIEADSTWDTINGSSDVINLLKLIRQSLFTRAATRHPTHTYIEAEAALARFRQGERMSNSEYLEKLKGLISVFEHLGGEPGITGARVKTILDAEDDSKGLATPVDRAAARIKAREEYIAVLLIVKSDPKRYGQLVQDIQNQHTRGLDGYPCTISEAYDILVNYRGREPGRNNDYDSDISFAAVDEGIEVPGNRSSCGGRGHRGGRGGRRASRGDSGGSSACEDVSRTNHYNASSDT